MAISAYVGVPGSGKSYEVVKSVILPAIASGRRVVSNVYGLDKDKIYSYLLRKNKKLSEEKLGDLVCVNNDKCLVPDFLPSMENPEAFCKSGDLIVIDEVWRIWDSDKDIPKSHRSFIAEHRHFADSETGITCDLVVINQDVAQIPRFIKDRIETTYRMQKHVGLGFRNRYRVDVFQGIKLFKSSRITYYQEKYDKEIFELYKSYEADNAKEGVTDSRQNIFSSNKFVIYTTLVISTIIISIYFLYNFFAEGVYSGVEKKNVENNESYISSNNKQIQDELVISKDPVFLTSKNISTKWRIIGELKRSNSNFVVLIDSKGRLRLEPRGSFQYSGRMLQGEVDNEIVTYYSGEF